jgi:isopenicillin-N epimerase
MGQIFPVRTICQMARARGIRTIVDGAHAFALLRANARELDCDYYGTSLHKWLPAGSAWRARCARSRPSC